MAAEEALLKRVLPQNMEAEQAVVGSMIMDKEAISVASEMLTGDDFYSKQYGVVFDTMVELNDQGKAVDPVTLQDRLRAKDVPPEMVSLDFIRDIMRSVTTSANVKYYAGIVAEKSTLRKLIRLNQDIENTCYAGKEDLEVNLESTEKQVFELVQKRNTGEYVPIRQVVKMCIRDRGRLPAEVLWMQPSVHVAKKADREKYQRNYKIKACQGVVFMVSF